MCAPPVWFTFKWLKSSTDTETENALTLVEGDARQFVRESDPRVRIIGINQSKRHVDNGHLETQLKADAGAYIADAVEDALAETNRRVLLHLAAQEDLLEAERQTRQRVKGTGAQSVRQLFLRDEPRIAHYQAAANRCL